MSRLSRHAIIALVLLSAASAPARVPSSGAVLAILKHHGDKVRLVRRDAVRGRSTVAAEVPARDRVSWSYDGARVLFWTPQKGPVAPPLILVILRTGEQREIPAPAHGDFDGAGFDAEGSIHGMTCLLLSSGKGNGNDGGAFANDFVWTAPGEWQQVSSERASTGCSGGLVEAVASGLGPVAGSWRSAMDSVSREDLPRRVLKRLMASTPDDPDPPAGERQTWSRLKSEPAAYVRHRDGIVMGWDISARVVVLDRGAAHVLEMPGDRPWQQSAEVYARGPYVLIRPMSEATRLYDVRTRRLLYESREETYFWPTPQKTAAVSLASYPAGDGATFQVERAACGDDTCPIVVHLMKDGKKLSHVSFLNLLGGAVEKNEKDEKQPQNPFPSDGWSFTELTRNEDDEGVSLEITPLRVGGKSFLLFDTMGVSSAEGIPDSQYALVARVGDEVKVIWNDEQLAGEDMNDVRPRLGADGALELRAEADSMDSDNTHTVRFALYRFDPASGVLEERHPLYAVQLEGVRTSDELSGKGQDQCIVDSGVKDLIFADGEQFPRLGVTGDVPLAVTPSRQQSLLLQQCLEGSDSPILTLKN